MGNRGLFILIEGPDDNRFVERVISKPLSELYAWVKTYEYAHKAPKEVCALIRCLGSMNADYIFLKDLDLAPCVTFRKEKVREKYVVVDNANILVVKREIEGWYLAGLDRTMMAELGLETYGSTDELTKEEFIKRMPRRYTSRIDFLQEILKRYSMEMAQERNSSFRYFLRKYQLL